MWLDRGPDLIPGVPRTIDARNELTDADAAEWVSSVSITLRPRRAAPRAAAHAPSLPPMTAPRQPDSLRSRRCVLSIAHSDSKVHSTASEVVDDPSSFDV